MKETCHIQNCLDHLAKKVVKPVIAINPGTPIQVLEEIVDYIAGVLVLPVNPGFAGQNIVPHTIEKKQHVFVNIWMIWDIRRYILNPTETLPVRMRQKLYKNGSDIFVAGTKQYFPGGRY